MGPTSTTAGTSGTALTAGAGAAGARATLLLLADGRLPAGGHAHSGGVEAAVLDGSIAGLDDLAAFLLGRLRTNGLVTAAFAAAACHAARLAGVTGQAGAPPDAGPTGTAGTAAAGGPSGSAGPGAPLAEAIALLEAELDARTPSPAQRAASRAQGRTLLRVGRAAWPVPPAPPALHHPIALGLVAAAAGLLPGDAALAAAHGAVNGPATAATRLLGLDPLAVTGMLAGLAGEVERVAAQAEAVCRVEPCRLPAAGAPLLDLLAERHRLARVRMFSS